MTLPAVAPFVRVVVLNWNAAWLTARCVRSVQATEYPEGRMEIVVVDNASIDGSPARLRHDLAGPTAGPTAEGRPWTPGVRFVDNEANLGFAEGNNRALRDLDRCDYVALVNNDAMVEPGWLTPLVEALEADDGLGGAAPKMLLETAFTTIGLVGSATVGTVTVDGVDVTRRCLFDDAVERADPDVPLGLLRVVGGAATIHVPVGSADAEVTIRWEPAPGSETDAGAATGEPTLELRSTDEGPRLTDAGPGWLTATTGSSRSTRINSLGTELTPWTEGRERWFGQLDRPHLATHDVWGFSGGGVLLRPRMLREVGLFDPRYFAYYEDTDLVWRARRNGWRFACVPESRVRHLHGGSAGPEARGFFFLNYRNWLLTVLRNGSPRQLLRAAGVARRLSWGPFRRNVFGPLRRMRRPSVAITAAWSRVFAGVVAAAVPTLVGRWSRLPLGSRPATRVWSRLMPVTRPRAPRPRAGGPLLCYVDVTESLRSGWRAGIQRVVCEVVRALPADQPDVELVPVCWSKVHGAFRRLDTAEYERLLAPTATEQPNTAPPPPTNARRLLARAMHTSGAAPVVHRYRRWRELRATSPEHLALLIDRFEPGSVFLDIDASWNPTTQPRSELLPLLRAGGVGVAVVQYDLIPHTHPQWFIPQMVSVFMAHVDAHLAAGSTFLCISRHTRDELLGYASTRGATPDTLVVPMGADVPAPKMAASAATDAPYFLAVGTVEPRKGHATILDAFEKVRAEHPTATLVIVGRAGWTNTAVTDRLTAGPPGVVWRTAVSDAELDGLYRGATAVVIASVTEGFGLPVIEALVRGIPVLSSDGGALPEAGGDSVEYFRVGAVDELRELMADHLDDPGHHDARRALAAAFEPVGWHATTTAIAAALRPLA